MSGEDRSGGTDARDPAENVFRKEQEPNDCNSNYCVAD
jgi:hypothetical protein